MSSSGTREYWERYYSAGGPVLVPPSQFAAFVLGETPDHALVLDIGCGSGRDSLFFASFGRKVVGVDASENAIERCNAAKRAFGAHDATFMVGDLSSPRLAGELGSLIGEEQRPLIFARFFLHAVPEEVEAAFLALAARHVRQGTFAVEFRTLRDRGLDKATPDHFRRFIDPVAFAARAQGFGLFPAYYVEGFGMAKYRQDDAYVARLLLRTARA